VSEENIVRQAIEGNQWAFTRLYDEHFDKVYRYVYLRIGNRPEAEDLTQEVFIRVFKAAKRYRPTAKFKTWLCEYSESTPVGTMYNGKTGIVKVNRTEILDSTHRLVTTEGMLEIPAVCPEVKQFALECAAIAKVEEVNKRTRQQIFRYHKLDSAPDDYRHALNYFYLAASGGKIGVAGGRERRNRPTHARNDYVMC